MPCPTAAAEHRATFRCTWGSTAAAWAQRDASSPAASGGRSPLAAAQPARPCTVLRRILLALIGPSGLIPPFNWFFTLAAGHGLLPVRLSAQPAPASWPRQLAGTCCSGSVPPRMRHVRRGAAAAAPAAVTALALRPRCGACNAPFLDFSAEKGQQRSSGAAFPGGQSMGWAELCLQCRAVLAEGSAGGQSSTEWGARMLQGAQEGRHMASWCRESRTKQLRQSNQSKQSQAMPNNVQGDAPDKPPCCIYAPVKKKPLWARAADSRHECRASMRRCCVRGPSPAAGRPRALCCSVLVGRPLEHLPRPAERQWSRVSG